MAGGGPGTVIGPRKPEHRRLARDLRARGWSLQAIAAALGVAKSSVSRWTRDVERDRGRPPGAEPLPALVGLPVWHSGHVRRCGRCGMTLPDVAFNRSGTGRQWWCRRCFAAYFRDRGRRHREQSAAAKKVRRAAARDVLMRHLAAYPCRDCGLADPVVLECDHVAGKTAEIARLVADGAVSRLGDELTRCEVVCANCHRRRTARRAGWLRSLPDWQHRLERRDDVVARNLGHIYRALEAGGCVDCGTRELTLLEFDHLGRKRADVTAMARDGLALATLDREIAGCAVRCANCHRRRTAAVAGSHRTSGLTLPEPS